MLNTLAIKFKKIFASSAAFLLTPWASMLSIVLGLVMGIYYKDLVCFIVPYGNIYLALLNFCVIPILVTAIASSLAEIIISNSSSHDGGKRITRMALLLVALMLFCAIAGIVTASIAQPGARLSDETRILMANLVEKSSDNNIEMVFYAQGEDDNPNAFSFSRFLVDSAPSNLFKALASGNILQILIIAIILGIALGSLKKTQAESGIGILECFYHAFLMIIRWSMYVLPFGLFALVAEYSSKMGLAIFSIMGAFIFSFYIAGALLLIAGLVMMSRFTGLGIFKLLSALKDSIIMAAITRNSLATMPFALDALVDHFKYDETYARLQLSFGITIGRFCSIFYFSMIAIFTAQLYNASLSPGDFVIIVVFSILAGMASSGGIGIIGMTLVSVVLEPLALPWDVVLILLLAIDTITDPLKTVINLLFSCLYSAILNGKVKQEGEAVPEPSTTTVAVAE